MTVKISDIDFYKYSIKRFNWNDLKMNAGWLMPLFEQVLE